MESMILAVYVLRTQQDAKRSGILEPEAYVFAGSRRALALLLASFATLATLAGALDVIV